MLSHLPFDILRAVYREWLDGMDAMVLQFSIARCPIGILTTLHPYPDFEPIYHLFCNANHELLQQLRSIVHAFAPRKWFYRGAHIVRHQKQPYWFTPARIVPPNLDLYNAEPGSWVSTVSVPMLQLDMDLGDYHTRGAIPAVTTVRLFRMQNFPMQDTAIACWPNVTELHVDVGPGSITLRSFPNLKCLRCVDTSTITDWEKASALEHVMFDMISNQPEFVFIPSLIELTLSDRHAPKTTQVARTHAAQLQRLHVLADWIPDVPFPRVTSLTIQNGFVAWYTCMPMFPVLRELCIDLKNLLNWYPPELPWPSTLRTLIFLVCASITSTNPIHVNEYNVPGVWFPKCRQIADCRMRHVRTGLEFQLRGHWWEFCRRHN